MSAAQNKYVAYYNGDQRYFWIILPFDKQLKSLVIKPVSFLYITPRV